MYSRNKTVPNFQQNLTSDADQQPLLNNEPDFESSSMSGSSTVLDLGGLTSNWQNHSQLTYRMGNSKIRFQKPFALALLLFGGVVVILFFSFSGHSLRSNSKYSNYYGGDSFLANYGKIEASTLAFPLSREKKSTYNSTYPLTSPGTDSTIKLHC